MWDLIVLVPDHCLSFYFGTFMLKFYVKIFRTSLFPNPMMYLVYVWCDDGYWSRIVHSTIPTPIHDLKVKVTDLELLC